MFVTASAQDVSVLSRDGSGQDMFTIMINNTAARVLARDTAVGRFSDFTRQLK